MRIVILFFLISLVFSLPIGKDVESEETTVASKSASKENEILDEEMIYDEEPEEIEEENQEEVQDEQEKEEEKRVKRGMYSSERQEEVIEIHHGIHKRNAEHQDQHRVRRHDHHNLHHQTNTTHKLAKRHTEETNHHQVKRSDHHEAQKRHSEAENHSHPVKRSDDTHHRVKRNTEDHEHHDDHHKVKRSSDVHGHQIVKDEHDKTNVVKRNSDDHHGTVKRSDCHHSAIKRNSDSEHPPHHTIIKRSDDGFGHIMQKRDPGQKTGAHRQPRSADQGHEEDDPADEIRVDENEEQEKEDREKRSIVGGASSEEKIASAKFASDVEPINENSVAVRRVKRVSRAGSSHKVRTLTKNRGNSKAGGNDTTKNNNPSSANS